MTAQYHNALDRFEARQRAYRAEAEIEPEAPEFPYGEFPNYYELTHNMTDEIAASMPPMSDAEIDCLVDQVTERKRQQLQEEWDELQAAKAQARADWLRMKREGSSHA